MTHATFLAPLALSVLLAAPSLALAQCPNDDAFEDNDTEATAAVLPLGLTTGLRVFGSGSPGGQDDDYWLIPDVPPDHVITIEIANVTANDPLQFRVTGELSGLEAVTFKLNGALEFVIPNTEDVAQDYIVLVAQDSLFTGCDEYTLDLAIDADPCLGSGGDGFEDNDDCNSWVPLAPGTYSDLQMTIDDHDYYAVDVPHGFDLTVDQVDPGLFRGLVIDVVPVCLLAGTPDLQQDLGGQTGLRSLTHTNDSGVTQTVYIKSFMWGDPCSLYDLTLTLSPTSCTPALDDAFEPNDDCASAAVLAAGIHEGLLAGRSNPDHYRVQVNPGRTLSVDQLFLTGDGIHELELFTDAACTSPAAGVTADAEANRATWFNGTGSVATIYLRCTIAAAAPYDCGLYDLSVSTGPEPCSPQPADDFAEDNDECGTASLAYFGLDLDLFVSKQDVDVYKAHLPDGDWITAVLTPANPFADLEVYLFDDPLNCDDFASGWLVSDSTSSNGNDFVNVAWINQTGATQTYYLLVRIAPDSPSDCTFYDSVLRRSGLVDVDETFCHGDGTAGPRGAHDTACPCGNASASGTDSGCANSTGLGAALRVQYAPLVAGGEDVFRLHTSQGRPNMPAMAVQGRSTIATPFKDGVLCLGNPTERLEVLTLDANGDATTATDLRVAGDVFPGDRVYYQVWYRDPTTSPCGFGSNFTNGVVKDW